MWTLADKLPPKEERIKRSLEALNAPNPINLSLQEWKEIMESADKEVEG